MDIENERLVNVPSEMEGVMDSVCPESWLSAKPPDMSPHIDSPIHAYPKFARRLTACWNACLGIPTEQLEGGVLVMPDMERSYIGGDVMIWRQAGKDAVDVERIANETGGWIRLTVHTRENSPVYWHPGFGTRWLDAKTAREIGRTLLAWADTIEQDRGYCHDPLAVPEEKSDT